MNEFEMNNVRKDSDLFNNKFHKGSPVVEIFSAMVNGRPLEKWGAKADVAVNYIKGLGERATNGDYSAIAELNTLRRFTVETPLLEEIQMLSIFGSYQNIGYDETIEREVYKHVGEHSREQAPNGDVVFPSIVKDTYVVPTFTVSGGYQCDYRRISLGDMSKENEGMAMVRTDIANQAKLGIIKRIYKAITEATGVKYTYEDAGLTKTDMDALFTKMRRYGRLTFIGDYALISQFTPWAGYVGTINSNTITGISEATLNQIAQNGALAMYNGVILAEMENPYNLYQLNADGDNFETLLPAGLGFVVPSGINSPIATYTRGGLTSFTGNDVASGRQLTRFDLEVACDIAKGEEYMIGCVCDTNLSSFD